MPAAEQLQSLTGQRSVATVYKPLFQVLLMKSRTVGEAAQPVYHLQMEALGLAPNTSQKQVWWADTGS